MTDSVYALLSSGEAVIVNIEWNRVEIQTLQAPRLSRPGLAVQALLQRRTPPVRIAFADLNKLELHETMPAKLILSSPEETFTLYTQADAAKFLMARWMGYRQATNVE